MNRRSIWTLGIILFILLMSNFLFPALYSSTGGLFTDRKSQLSIYSDEWDGLSTFRRELDDKGYKISTIISNPLILEEVDQPSASLYICIGAEKGYDPIQRDALLRFVNNGGKVLIADDYGDATSFSENLGVSFTGHRIWSPDYDNNLSFIRIKAPANGNEHTILLNEPTTLKLLGKSHALFNSPTVIYKTEPGSYEDSNDNGRIDSIGDLDTYGELPVGVKVNTKENNDAFIFIGDSSFCINGMWEREQNALFAIDLVEELLGSSGHVIFDESRHIQPTPLVNSVFSLENIYIYVILQSDQLLGTVIFLNFLIVFGLVYLLTKPPHTFRHRFDLTYWDSYVEQAPDRLADVRSILMKRMKAHYNLYFPDSTDTYAYESSTKTQYNLTKKADLLILVEDNELVDFLLHPYRFNVADRLNSVVLKIDDIFPLQEGMN